MINAIVVHRLAPLHSLNACQLAGWASHQVMLVALAFTSRRLPVLSGISIPVSLESCHDCVVQHPRSSNMMFTNLGMSLGPKDCHLHSQYSFTWSALLSVLAIPGLLGVVQAADPW